MEKITGKTSTGFEFNYDKRIITDWSYITLLRKMTNDDTSNTEKLDASQKVIILLLGEEQPDRLIKHVRENNDGFAPLESIILEFNEMIEPKNL